MSDNEKGGYNAYIYIYIYAIPPLIKTKVTGTKGKLSGSVRAWAACCDRYMGSQRCCSEDTEGSNKADAMAKC